MRVYIEQHNKRVQEARKRAHSRQVHSSDKTIGRIILVCVVCLAIITITQVPNALDHMWEQQYEKVEQGH
jgi:ABC-type anion transport system duplicated permease subunit